jgi:hypothetical protein
MRKKNDGLEGQSNPGYRWDRFFGKKFIEIMLNEFHPAKLIVYSRDEQKQHEMRQMGFEHESLRYLLVISVTWNVCVALFKSGFCCTCRSI